MERQRALARERQRRRRANSAVRQREAQAKRQRRQENPQLRQAAVEAQRQRRQANPSVKVKEAQAKRQKRQANPAVKVKEAQAERKRRQANPQVQVRNTQGKRQRRAANPQVRIREAELRRRQRQQPETGGADARFKRDFLDRSFGHSCKLCDRLWFDDALVKIGNTRNPESRANALGVREREFPATSSANFSEYQVFSTCKDSLIAGRMSHVATLTCRIRPACLG